MAHVPRRGLRRLPGPSGVCAFLPELGLLPREGMDLGGFRHGKSEHYVGPCRQAIENEIPPGPKRRGRPQVDRGADRRHFHPTGNAHRQAPRGLVVDDQLPLVGEVAVHVQPRGSAVQEQVDLHFVIGATQDGLPGAIHRRRAVARAANRDHHAVVGYERGMRGVGKEDADVALEDAVSGFTKRIERTASRVPSPTRVGHELSCRSQFPCVGDLQFSQVVADVAVGVVPVISDTRITELKRQVGHVAGRAALAEVAEAREAEIADVLITGTHELLEPRVVHGNRVAKQPHQTLRV